MVKINFNTGWSLGLKCRAPRKPINVDFTKRMSQLFIAEMKPNGDITGRVREANTTKGL